MLIDVRLLELFQTYSSVVKFKNVPACLCMVDRWRIDLLCALLLILFNIFSVVRRQMSVTDVRPTSVTRSKSRQFRTSSRRRTDKR